MRVPELRCRTAFQMVFIVLVTLAGSFVVADPAAADPRRVTSNARSLLAGTFFDARTGDGVAVIGIVHVQTRTDIAAGTVAVHANLTDTVLAYAVGRTPSDPRLDRLEELTGQVRTLKQQLAALLDEIADLQRELDEVRKTDVNPFLPGTQIDEERAQALATALAQASAAAKRVQEQLRDLQNEIAELVDELQEHSSAFEEYEFSGAAFTKAAPCSAAPVCERRLDFDLVRADGSRSSVPVVLRLLLSARGDLLQTDADFAVVCEESCGIDQDACPCS